MKLFSEVKSLWHSDSLPSDAEAQQRCARAKVLEESGDYDEARRELGDLWRGVGERPIVEHLSSITAAEVLLRVGRLSSLIGSAQQLEGIQEVAKDLITESVIIFKSLKAASREASAQADLAEIYWREGAFDEARIILSTALTLSDGRAGDLRALILLRISVMERCAGRLNEAYRRLMEASSLVEASNHTLKGILHNTLALVLRKRGADSDQVLMAYTAASFHFEQAQHIRYRARTENNLGFLYFTLLKFDQAHQHLDCARRLFEGVRDVGSIAQVDETRARVLLGQGLYHEAEQTAFNAVRILEKGGQQALLSEAIVTHGTTMLRQGRRAEALITFRRALKLSELMGDGEGVKRATHAMEGLDKQGAIVIPFQSSRGRALQTFTVRLSDNSLSGAGYVKNTVLTFRQSSDCQEGNLVFVKTPAGHFVAFLFRKHNWVCLAGAHPQCPIRHYLQSEVDVLGVAELDK